jgi:hypothetical protein
MSDDVTRLTSIGAPVPSRLRSLDKQDFGRLGEQLVTREQSLAIESDAVKSRARPLPPPEDGLPDPEPSTRARSPDSARTNG